MCSMHVAIMGVMGVIGVIGIIGVIGVIYKTFFTTVGSMLDSFPFRICIKKSNRRNRRNRH